MGLIVMKKSKKLPKRVTVEGQYQNSEKNKEENRQ